MKFLSAARGRSVSDVAASDAVASDALPRARCLTTFAGLTALALLAGCGAGGEDTGDGVITNPNGGNGPSMFPNGGGGAPFIGPNCQGDNDPSCALVDAELPPPPGCGNGILTEDEACDDGNQTSGDGCLANCLRAESGFSCATAGQPCRAIARCGDGLVAATEQCDDANVDSADGCSNRCRVELGKKCEGAPSVCTDAICGNGEKEGAEACDDGNTAPFDGCSPICLKEPNCEGLSCTSDCGDGLLIDEDCDDGNTVDGDGCSSTCTVESGFTCVAEAACEQVAGQCVLRVPAIFRDFADSHPDFGGHACTALAPGGVADQLGADGRPALGAAAAAACMSNAQNFADWYTSNERNVTLVGEITLFDNGAGGYVNRFGAEGQKFEAVDPDTERGGGNTLAACGATCENEAANATQCANTCRPPRADAQQLTNGDLIRLTNELNQAQNAAVPDLADIAALEAEIAGVQADIDALIAEADACDADCELRRDTRAAECTATCKPCSYNPATFCIEGELLSFDGSPLFFPVDSITGPTANSVAAKIPAQYGYNAFPFESAIFPGAPNHNFFFTSEVQYWFQYDADTQATLTFLGDDDVWVFINGRLAVDLGGIHVPSTGSVTINAAAGTVVSRMQDGREQVPPSPPINRQATTADFGLVEGNVYTITIFHAERQIEGSSFQLTLAGFEATPSDCSAICGDSVLSFGEECDDGVNDGGYGECNTGCVLGPFCGDGVRQPEFNEDCDVGPIGDAACRNCREITIQ